MWIFYSAIQAALELKRTCPACKHSQLIKLNSRDKAVKCKRCGESIPPPPPHSRKR